MRQAFIIAFAAFAPAAIAADTANLSVSAVVHGTCTFESAEPIDFSRALTGANRERITSGSVTYRCTKGVPYTVELGMGSNASGTVRHMTGPAEGASPGLVPYDLVSTSPTSGVGKGPAIPETNVIIGKIRGVDSDTVSGGSYADTVIITIMY